LRALKVILLAAWAGLVAGSANALWFLALWLGGTMVFADKHYLWMAPIATMVFFVVLSLPVAVVSAVRRAGVPQRPVTWCFAMMTLATALLPVPFLHPMASLVLASGLALVLSRALLRPRWSGRVIAGGLLLVVLPALVASALVNRPSALRSHARMPAEGAPNVLLLILDTVRADALSIYGSPHATSPRLDSLARTSTFFRWAMAPSSWTLPSHSSFFTGVSPSMLSARWRRRLDDQEPSLAEVLNAAGWRTGGFVGNQVYGSWGGGLTRGFERYQASSLTLRELRLSVTFLQLPLVRKLLAARSIRGVVEAFRTGRLAFPHEPTRDHYPARDLLGEFQQWRREDRSRPFFAFVNLFEAHETDMVPEHWLRRFDGGRTLRDRYDGIVAWEDSVVGALVDTLAVEGILDRTLIIVSSDHGEMFGRHNVSSHGNSLYLGVQRVPLIVRFPDRLALGREINAPVSLQDVPATVEDVLGLPKSFPGRSWRTYLADSTVHPVLGEVEQEPLFSRGTPVFLGPLRSLVDDRWRCILHADGRMEVFAYRSDLEELYDLVPTRAGSEVAQRCRTTLARIPFGYETVSKRPRS